MARRRLILVPPSEGKALGGEGVPWHAADGAEQHPLFTMRSEVVGALGERVAEPASAGDLSKLFGVSGAALARAVAADSALDTAPTLPAVERYDGVLYQHLELDSMTPGQRRRLDRSVRIVSGLWGLVAPHELIPDYRLKMSASLEGLGKLSTWWRGALSELVAAEARGAELWDLLPNEHAAALSPPPRSVRTTAVFLSPDRSGRLVPVSHWNKALKGALVSHLVRHPSATVEDLLEWDHPAGYRLDAESLEVRDRLRTLRFVERS